MQGGFPIDLILFAMVAAFLVLRLRSVLGKRQGFERPPQTPGMPEARASRAEGVAEEIVPARAGSGAKRSLPTMQSPVGQAVSRIVAADPSFDPQSFLDGAEGAFRMIVGAFAQGDRQTLRALLSDETYSGFEQAVAGRETESETQRTEIRSMHELVLEGAELRGSMADVIVRFVSDQLNMTTGRGGEIVAGSDAITEVIDIWTFQRDLSAKDPTWKLTGTRSG